MTRIAFGHGPALALAGLALAVGLGLTAALLHWLRQAAEVEDRLRFTQQVESLQADVQARFALPLYGLAGLRASVAVAEESLGRDAFRRYVEARDLEREFPGVRGFAYVQRVMRDAVPAFEAAEQAAGAPFFKVRGSGDAPELYVIRYIEPLSRNAAALGFDLGSEALRRQAIERAIDTGLPTLTAPLMLMQDERRSPGFLYIVPLYRAGADPVTVAQRRAALLGLAYTPLVVAELLAGAAEQHGARLDFQLLAQADAPRPAVVFDSERALSATAGEPVARTAHYADRHLAVTRTLEVGQQVFELHAGTNAAFERASDDRTAWSVGVGGVLLSALLASTLWLLARGQARAQAAAAAMTTDLQRLAREQAVMLDSELVGILKLRDGVPVWSNRGLARLFGYDAAALKGVSLQRLHVDAAHTAALQAAAEPVLRAGGTYRTQLQMRHSSGALLWVDLSGVLVSSAPEEALWLMVDITAMKAQHVEMEQAALHDALTGLPNRTLLADRLAQALAQARRQGHALAVAYMDLDGFKAVNDSLGHAAGDAVLRAVAERLPASLRSSDTVARLGGDEFVLLLAPAGTPEAVGEVLQRVQAAVTRPVALPGGGQVAVGASVGLAWYPEDGGDADALLALADQRMFEAKRARHAARKRRAPAAFSVEAHG